MTKQSRLQAFWGQHNVSAVSDCAWPGVTEWVVGRQFCRSLPAQLCLYPLFGPRNFPTESVQGSIWKRISPQLLPVIFNWLTPPQGLREMKSAGSPSSSHPGTTVLPLQLFQTSLIPLCLIYHLSIYLPTYLPVTYDIYDIAYKYIFIMISILHWKRKWQPTPVFLPGEFHGPKRNLVGYSLWACQELDTTERLSTTHIYCIIYAHDIYICIFIMQRNRGKQQNGKD